MAHHTHIDSGNTGPSKYRDGEITHITVCGEQGEILGKLAKDAASATCPKCSAIYFGSLVPSNYKLEKWDELANTGRTWKQYRSVYMLKIDGVHRAYITAENGWGAGWCVRDCDNARDDGAQRPDSGAISFGNRRSERHFTSCNEAVHAVAEKIARAEREGKELNYFFPAMTVEEWKTAEAERGARNRALAEQRRLDEIASSDVRLGELGVELAGLEARVTALRGINVEAPASADALAWAIELAMKQVASVRGSIEHTTKYRNRRARGED